VNIFNKINYRLIIKEIVENKKKIDPKINFQSLSTHARIQKAYLSQVINGHRDLNQDQLYLTCDYLELKDHEVKYLRLLLEYSRSALADRKSVLKKKIREMQDEYSSTSKTIDVDEQKITNNERDLYFLEPLHQLVHIALTISSFRKDLKLLAKSLHLPHQRVIDCIQNLEKMEIISTQNGKITDLAPNMHLSPDSPIFKAWKSSLNMLAQSRIHLTNAEDKYDFSVVFSADDETKREIHQAFMQFLKKIKKNVEKAPAKEVYQMNFDLFRWTQK